MNTVDEASIRDQLAQAVEILDPVAPPLAAIEASAAKRRRTFRIAGGLGAVALAGACAVVAAVVITSGPGTTAKVTPATAPTTQSLTDFAIAHGAIHSRFGRIVAGPFEGSGGFYGAFTVKPGVQVASWNGSSWELAGAAVSKLGPGRFLMKLGPGPELAGASSIYVRSMGGDVSYFGSVLEPRGRGLASRKVRDLRPSPALLPGRHRALRAGRRQRHRLDCQQLHAELRRRYRLASHLDVELRRRQVHRGERPQVVANRDLTGWGRDRPHPFAFRRRQGGRAP